MILFLIIILSHSILSAWFNYQIIEDKKWHTLQALSLAPLFFFVFIERESLTDYFYIIGTALIIRWIVFDISLNVMRKLPFHYVGNTAFLDRIFGGFQNYIKLILLFFVIIILIQWGL